MDDSISRQAAIKALKICDRNEDGKNCHMCPLRDERWNGAWEDGNTTCYEKLMLDAAKILDGGEWIYVRKELPNSPRQVLAFSISQHYVLAKYDNMMQPDGTWKNEWVTFDAWKPMYKINNVIAWKDLPEAPAWTF